MLIGGINYPAESGLDVSLLTPDGLFGVKELQSIAKVRSLPNVGDRLPAKCRVHCAGILNRITRRDRWIWNPQSVIGTLK